MKYPGDISPEAYAAMEEGYDQGRADGRKALVRLRAGVEALAERWEALSEQDPHDPGNPGGYAAELRAVLDWEWEPGQ